MARICRGLVIGFAGAYALALGLLAIGTFGLFGQERDPLAGVFLLPLGLPWTYLLDPIARDGSPWIAIGAPGINLSLLWALCHAVARRDRRREGG